jgi:DNA helicase IV
MAAVIANAVAYRRRPLGKPVVVRIGLHRAVLEPDEVDALVEEQLARGVPYNVGRAALRTRLVNLVYRRFGVLETEPRELTKAIRANDSLRAALDAVWPAVSSRALVRELLSNRDELARAADGVLDESERDAIHGPRSAKWTTSDLALIDEARALLEGHIATYGHAIVDEAQDLSPMQLRMIGRRAPSGSVTVLGDLAQSTAVWSHESWAEVVAHLATPDGWHSTDLTLGYRVPGQVLDFAARLLPEAAPRVPRTESVRRGLRPPRLVRADEGAAGARAASEAEALRQEGFLVGCIVAPEQHGAVARAFDDAGVEYGTPERDGILKPITIIGAPTAKGLEFDAVVVVEPAAIADGSARGLRLLYVALTRPIQHLSVVHERPLPSALAARATR